LENANLPGLPGEEKNASLKRKKRQELKGNQNVPERRRVIRNHKIRLIRRRRGQQEKKNGYIWGET